MGSRQVFFTLYWEIVPFLRCPLFRGHDRPGVLQHVYTASPWKCQSKENYVLDNSTYCSRASCPQEMGQEVSRHQFEDRG
jgi:hypothetical protein